MFLETEEIEKDCDDENHNEMAIDTLKLGINKINMINDKIYNLSNYDKLKAIFPILSYHSRIKNIKNNNMFKNKNQEEKNCFEGYVYTNKICKVKESKSKYLGISNESKEKIDEINVICKENNCKLILISVPDKGLYNKRQSEEVEKYANSEKIDFLELNNKNIIDWNKCSQDENGFHLNIYGAQSVGKYLAEYIKSENYNFSDHRNDKKYKGWDEELSKYIEQKLNDKIAE